MSLVDLVHEIDRSYVSTEEKQGLMDQYHARVGKDLNLLSCASCGVRALESDREFDWAQMQLTSGFPFSEQIDCEENESGVQDAMPVFQYKRYRAQTHGATRVTKLTLSQVQNMCHRLYVDKDTTTITDAIREQGQQELYEELFAGLSREHQVHRVRTQNVPVSHQEQPVVASRRCVDIGRLCVQRHPKSTLCAHTRSNCHVNRCPPFLKFSQADQSLYLQQDQFTSLL